MIKAIFLLRFLFVAVSEGKTLVQLRDRCPDLQGTASTTRLAVVDIETDSNASRTLFQLRLEPFPTGLCTLTIVSTNSQNPYLIPVARSFDNREWQLAAGPFAASLNLDCPAMDEVCKINLPPIQATESYRLTAYKPYTTNSRADTIRFLERATFGATGDQPVIENLEDWLEQQFNEHPTLHRQVFRQYANPRSNQHTRIAAAGPHPCSMNSRWRKYAFTTQDAGRTLRMMTNRKPQGDEIYLTIDGVFRTKISTPIQLVRFNDNLGDTVDEEMSLMNYDTDYEICGHAASFYQESQVVRVQLRGEEGCLQFRHGNPNILLPNDLVDGEHSSGNSRSYLLSISNFALTPIDDKTYPSVYWKSYQSGDEFRLAAEIDEPSCSIISIAQGPPNVFARVRNTGTVLLFDPRIVMQENTVQNPIPDGGGSLVLETNNLVECANAPRSFLNEDHCLLSTSANACRASETIKAQITLSEDFIKTANKLESRYIYAVESVPINDESYRDGDNKLRYYNEPPCGTQNPSRWMRVSDNVCQDPGYRSVGLGTETTFANLLKRSTAASVSLLQDVKFYSGLQCDAADRDKRSLGYVRGVDGQCWQHVNRRHLNVYDMTNFVSRHPGGVEPIVKWANQDSATIILPPSHQEDGNARLSQGLQQSTFLGKLGSRFSFEDLPGNLKTEKIQKEFGILPINPTGAGVVVCGSIGEVANDPASGSGYLISSFTKRPLPSKMFRQDQKAGIWAHIALSGLDQLRQRAAFALSQILVISPQLLQGEEGTETTLSYYDIFVRNTFGNYRNILKEVAFHPKMGEMLSSLNSKSYQYLEDRGEEAYPDENFAREIMQLFSIGLNRLNMNGTIQVDEDGEPLSTYDNSDILSFARVWTGLKQQDKRGNYEHDQSRVDPMAIEESWHDIFPKSDLHGGYIGDGYPLCVDMPEKHFLKKGAIYRLLGSRSSPELQEDLISWDTDLEIQRLQLDGSSPLFAQLCAKQTSESECSFPGKVTLEKDLDYNSFQGAEEYQVETLRTVQVQSDPVPIFYEYAEPTCVNHVFFNDSKRVVAGVKRSGKVGSMMCADPRHVVALESCCSNASINNNKVPFGSMNCKYNGERMSYATSQQRCREIGMVHCDLTRLRVKSSSTCSKDIDKKQNNRYLTYRWSKGSCAIQVKVDGSGNVAIVHNPEPDRNGDKSTKNGFHESNRNFFKVRWKDNNSFPSASNWCGDGAAPCTLSGQYCICDTIAQETAGFKSVNELSGDSVARIKSKLFVGSIYPNDFESKYLNRGNCNGRLDHVHVYTTLFTDCDRLDKDTIFAVFDSFERVSFLKNAVAYVRVGSMYSFRNPVTFSNFINPSTLDVHAEMDAAIDQYLRHPSHPPFLAMRMLQRFGFSNPSPHFVSVVAEAYQRGSFRNFGSGEYGDMKALLAAILLDPESTAASVNSDPFHGQLREPLLKVIAFLRAMNYEHNSPLVWPILGKLQSQIGEGVYEPPDVFSFFPPDFIPSGKLSAASLLSPESQVLNTGTITGLLEGMYTTTKYGVVPRLCYGGFGGKKPAGLRKCPPRKKIGDYSYSMGDLAYVPIMNTAQEIVDELAMLLTADRLQQARRQRISKEIEPLVSSDFDKALRLGQQLVVSTPEFHATNEVRSSGKQREIEPPAPPKSGDYKAVVYLMLKGGIDSFNLLIPKGECGSTDLYENYKSVRGKIALEHSDLDSIATSGQECKEFGVNKQFNILGKLYEEGEAMFFSNIGTLDKPVTKEDWYKKTRTSLFAHNIQQQELMRLDIGKELDLSGVGGRMMDTLKELGYQTASSTVASGKALATGSPNKANHVKTLPQKMPSEFNVVPETSNMDQLLVDLNAIGEIDSSLYSEQWSTNLVQSIDENRMTVQIYDQFKVTTDFPSGSISSKFKSAATWIKSREERNVERELIFVQYPGWDHHDVNGKNNLELKLAELNGAVTAFVEELKAQGAWDDVVIMSGSDFGRTLTPNSRGGTDHAWGGNNFMMGGGIKGGIIHGKYPSDLSENGEWNIGRGRLIPTLPNEAPWQAVAQWMGVTDSSDLDNILPNRKSFDTCSLFTDKQLFHFGSVETTCGAIVNETSSADDNAQGFPSTGEDIPQGFPSTDTIAEESPSTDTIAEESPSSQIPWQLVAAVTSGIVLGALLCFIFVRRRQRRDKGSTLP